MASPHFARRKALVTWRQRRNYWLRLWHVTRRLCQLLVQIGKLRGGICPILRIYELLSLGAEYGEGPYGDQRTLAEGVDPVLVPQQTQEFCVQARLEDLHLQRVVLVCVNAKVFDLIERDVLIFRCRSIGRRIPRRISSKGADVHSSSRDRTIRVDLSVVIRTRAARENSKRTTTAANGSVNFWLFICVLTSMPESQQPYPGCEWYHPIAFSNRPTCNSKGGAGMSPPSICAF